MAALEPLCTLIGFCPKELTKEEYVLIETELFFSICKNLEIAFKEKYMNYFQLMKLRIKREHCMRHNNLGRLIIEDILKTEEYDPQGIARYTAIQEEVVEEVIFGVNTDPSGTLLRKLIELHRYVRRDLYSDIIKKIIDQYRDYIKKEESEKE